MGTHESDLQKVALLVSPEVEATLIDNGVDIVDLLRADGLDVARTSGLPGASIDRGTREPVSVILASAALIAALTPAVTKAISTLSRKPVVVQEQRLVPVETSNGDIVRDNDGQPVLHWTTTARLLESERATRDRSVLEAEAPLGLKIHYTSDSDA